MEPKSAEEKQQCQIDCERVFVRCTSRQPSGCVEALRLCREHCKL
jgi:hypothetical protein